MIIRLQDGDTMTEMTIVLRATEIATNATETKTENETMNDDIENRKMALITEVHIVTLAAITAAEVEGIYLLPPLDITKNIPLQETRRLDMTPAEVQVDMTALDMKIADENEVRLQNDVVPHRT